MKLFELKNACVRYHDRVVLNDVSFVVNRAERIALVGESGAGKSTLLRLLYEQERSESVLIPQDMGLVNALSVFHNIFMGTLHRNPTWYNIVNLVYPIKCEVVSVRGIVQRLGLEEKLFEQVETLSGGQKQRTAVGRAIRQGGDIIIGDEPVSSVDEYQARSVLEYVNETHDTVLLAMHDVDLALAYSDRVIGLMDGRLVMDECTSGMGPSDLAELYRG